METQNLDVLGYVRPASAFRTLEEWEEAVGRLLDLQQLGHSARSQSDNAEFVGLVNMCFGHQLNFEVKRYELLTRKGVFDFIEDFINHRFWGLRQEYDSYFPDMSVLRFAYLYSRGDLEPYVMLDEEYTAQLHGTNPVLKQVCHFASDRGVANLERMVDAGLSFDISAYTRADRPFFRSESTNVVTLIGQVRAGFRSDVKSIALDNGRRACNMHRLNYPGEDSNICHDWESCDESSATSLWNEYIVTPVKIVDVVKIK